MPQYSPSIHHKKLNKFVRTLEPHLLHLICESNLIQTISVQIVNFYCESDLDGRSAAMQCLGF